jgi:GT2 family glycosyltransferase
MATHTQKGQALPPVSIIILTFNGAKYISQLLRSLWDQTYPHAQMEIIVVDNASVDDTVDIIRIHHPSVKLVRLSENIGFAAGNNQGLRHANHDLLVFLNQDTVCHPEFLTFLVGVMLKNQSLAACNPNIVTPNPPHINRVDMSSAPTSLFVCDLSPYGYGKNRVLRGNRLFYPKLLSGCAFIIRREAISKLGYLFDDRIWMYAEDSDLSLRLHSSGQRIGAVRDSVVYHLHNSDVRLNYSRLRLAARAIMNRVYIFFKNMNGPEFALFLPFLLLGGVFKIFEFSVPTTRKILFFLPFSIFSTICMLLALLCLPRFAGGNRYDPARRRIPDFSLLKRILGGQMWH